LVERNFINHAINKMAVKRKNQGKS